MDPRPVLTLAAEGDHRLIGGHRGIALFGAMASGFGMMGG
jgi:hypothetical protein